MLILGPALENTEFATKGKFFVSCWKEIGNSDSQVVVSSYFDAGQVWLRLRWNSNNHLQN